MRWCNSKRSAKKWKICRILAQLYSITNSQKIKTTNDCWNVFLSLFFIYACYTSHVVFIIHCNSAHYRIVSSMRFSEPNWSKPPFLFFPRAHWSMHNMPPRQTKKKKQPYTIPPTLFSKISASTCFLSHHLLPSCRPMLVPAKPNSINKSLALNASVWKTCCKRGT